MPELMLLRHGKSSWDEPGLADRDRTLSPRGRRDAEAMATVIAADYPPDRILCSPTRRTQETLAALLSRLGERPDVVIAEELYGQPGDYCDVIAAEGGEAEHLLVIGHNPAIQATALALVGSGDKALRAQLAEKFPTGALVVIRFKGKWSAIGPSAGKLVAFHKPRDLGGPDD